MYLKSYCHPNKKTRKEEKEKSSQQVSVLRKSHLKTFLIYLKRLPPGLKFHINLQNWAKANHKRAGDPLSQILGMADLLSPTEKIWKPFWLWSTYIFIWRWLKNFCYFHDDHVLSILDQILSMVLFYSAFCVHACSVKQSKEIKA